ncbi:MAG: alpha/beta hydrolase [Actinomycetia bacterium]|nr:alpha/beta hydrolase [Actinomycetes bacterium]MCP4963156.1 alpha/beta hydrolase [Actinomycetes bacterium]
MKQAWFTDTDGVEIFYRTWTPDFAPRGAFVIAHGASEHSGRYARFAESLNRDGWMVLALDHRGHGHSSKSTGTGKLGPRGLDGVLDDMDQLIEVARSSVGDKPVVLFGHSMGSIFAQAYVVRGSAALAGYVLSGCPGPPAEGLVELTAGLDAAVAAGMGDEPLDMLGTFNQRFEPARTPFDWLSCDESEVDAYIADPMCGDDNPLTTAYVAAMLGAARDSMTGDAISGIRPDLPVLLVTGEMDPVSGNGVQVHALEQELEASGRSVTAHYYPDARHEVLNETNRSQVTADIGAWLERFLRLELSDD